MISARSRSAQRGISRQPALRKLAWPRHATGTPDALTACMLKRTLILVLLLPALLGACYVGPRRHRAVQPTYVARCPDGYRYDRRDDMCRRPHPHRQGVIIELRAK